LFGGFGTSSFEDVALQVYGNVKLNVPYNLDDTVNPSGNTSFRIITVALPFGNGNTTLRNLPD